MMYLLYKFEVPDHVTFFTPLLATSRQDNNKADCTQPCRTPWAVCHGV
jgi:hypothetical protein